MCYEQRLAELAKAIGPYVDFVDTSQAEEFVHSWKNSQSRGAISVQRLAETLLLYADVEPLMIGGQLKDIGHSNGTKLSALREAIRACAALWLKRHQQELDRATQCEPLPVGA